MKNINQRMTLNDDSLVSIIIVNYNQRLYLQKCLKSIHENNHKRIEVILVDNNSTDDSLDFVRKNFPKVNIINLERNYGYAEPNNIGAKMAKGQLLYFLNNDTELCPNSISELVKVIREPDIVICQSLLLKSDGKVDSSGDFITTVGLAYKSVKKTDKIKPILSARGAAMMIRKDVFWELGGFDKKFFASFEDVDLGWRAWIFGYKVVLVPSSIVYHVGGKTVKMLEPQIKFHGIKNTILLILTNFDLSFAIKNIIMLPAEIISRKFSKIEKNVNSDNLVDLPSFENFFKAIFWIIKNFGHVCKKRKKVKSRRIRSTNELIKMELITQGRK